MVLALAGCSSAPGADPIAWWRQLEGGRLAQERPAAPNADAPYPNLGSVPARPVTTAAAARGGIAAGLESDRRDGAFAAGQPILPPVARVAAPEPVPAGGIGASLAAASAPAAPVVGGPVVARPVAAPAFVPGAPVGVAFAAGSAVLPEGAAEALRRLAATRAGRDVWVVGYGESTGSDAAGQAGTLRLGFGRAQAMAVVLEQAGVPASALRVAGEAVGRGGVARIAE